MAAMKLQGRFRYFRGFRAVDTSFVERFWGLVCKICERESEFQNAGPRVYISMIVAEHHRQRSIDAGETAGM
jgi:hypothetical protein